MDILVGRLTHGIAQQDRQESGHKRQEAGQRRVDRGDEGIEGLHMRERKSGNWSSKTLYPRLGTVGDVLARA